jgi:hypothetical protein
LAGNQVQESDSAPRLSFPPIGGFTFASVLTLGPLTALLKSEASWHDNFPAWQAFADECESLLVFLQERKALGHFWPRLRAKQQQRDEALNEIRVAYFLHSVSYPVVDWEPTDAGNRKLEYAVAISSQRMLVEVKSPGWEAELSDEQRSAGRANEPKYRENVSEGGPAGPVQVIRRAVEKALPKFSGNFSSLVVISDDCFVNLGEWGWGPLTTALTQKLVGGYGPGLFLGTAYSTIGAACLFRAVLYAGQNEVKYESLCLANPNSRSSSAVPEAAVKRLTTELQRGTPKIWLALQSGRV